MKAPLTRNDIDNLQAGQKIDELVAEIVMGEPHPGKFDKPEYWVLHVRKPDEWSPLPFSSELWAAWQIIDTFDRKAWDITIVSSSEDEGELWSVSFEQYTAEPVGVVAYGAGNHTSLPLAICRAALAANLPLGKEK